MAAGAGIVVSDGLTVTTEHTERHELFSVQPYVRRQVSLPPCVNPRVLNPCSPQAFMNHFDSDVNGAAPEVSSDHKRRTVKDDVPSRSLTDLVDDSSHSTPILRLPSTVAPSSRSLRKRRRVFSPLAATSLSEPISVQSQITNSPCLHLHLSSVRPQTRRARNDPDLIIVHVANPSSHSSASPEQSDDNGDSLKWRPVAWAHSLPCVVSIPVSPEDFAHTHVNIMLNAATRPIGTARAALSYLAHPNVPPVQIVAPARAVVIGTLSVSVHAPLSRISLGKESKPAVAITVRIAPSMRRDARHATTVQLARAAPRASTLVVAESRFPRRGERQTCLAAPNESILFGLLPRQIDFVELQVIWRSSLRRSVNSFNHGIWRLSLGRLCQLVPGELHALPWSEVVGLPAVNRSVLIGDIGRRDEWWCVDLTLTR